MKKEPEIINIFCYKLPFDLSNQIFKEYEDRIRDIKYLVEHFPFYSELKGDMETVKLLLALSIFFKRVVTNLDAAVKFSGTVSKYNESDTTVVMGKYELNGAELNKIRRVIISYNTIKNKYHISDKMFDYYETKEFLRNVKSYKAKWKEIDLINKANGEGKNKNT